MQLCPTCGRETPEGFPRCANCGAELAVEPLRQERKVVTVLFCDLVGFTRRAEAMDPEDVRALLAPYHAHVRSELERFGGTVEKFIGDAVMAVFGAPVAHEDDPERAVRAALAIRDWAQEEQLELRIGVNTGEALVTIGGEPLAAGDVVNTAARLQTAAPTGGILAGETTYWAARDRIEFGPAPAVDAKGKAEPVAAWEAVNARALVTVEREARAPLVGREREVALLLESLRRAREEREPQLVTLIGVPGIGKSRLVFELFKTLDAADETVYWRRGRSLPYGDGVTYWALGEMVKAEAGILESDTADEAAEKLRRTVEGLVAERHDAVWVERHLRPLVGLGADADRGTSEERRTAWRRFFEAMAERGPLVLVLEDLHWADDRLLDFVDELVDWSSGVPLLVAATARTELLARRPGWGGGKPNALTISLSPLSDTDTSRLVGHLLGRAVVAAETQSELLANAGGNPLFAEEFARLVEERGETGLEVPQSVQGIIAARIDALPAQYKELLQDAAVVGRSFWAGALATIGGVGPDEVERRLRALERREFVRRERRSAVSAEGEYVFRHALLRDVAYAQMPRGTRADRHRRAGEWIESLSPDRAEDRAEMLAHHYSAALDYARAAGRETDELVGAARRALVEAGDRALSLHAFGAATRFYSEALELFDERPEPALLLRIAKAFHGSDDPRARSTLEEASDANLVAGDRAGAAVAEALLQQLVWLQQDGAGSRAHRARALDLIAGEPASAAKAQVLARLASALQVGAESEHAIRLGREALGIAEALGLAEIVAHALTTIGGARAAFGDPGGIADFERAVQTALAANSPEALRAYNNLAASLRDLGDLERARATMQEGIRIAERFGGGPMLRFLRQAKTIDDYFAGEWDEALGSLEAFIAEIEGSPHYQESVLRGGRALIRAARSDLEGAKADIERGLEAARAAADPQAVAPALGIAARVHYMAGDLVRAKELGRELLELSRAYPSESQFVALLAPLAAPLGLEDELVELLDRAGPTDSRWFAVGRATVERRFLEAAEIYAAMPFPPDEAETRLRAAEQLLAEGRRAEADEQLRLAMDFWRSVRATWFIREAEKLLAATA